MADEDDHVIVKIEGDADTGAAADTVVVEKTAANGHDTTARTIPADDDLATQYEELRMQRERENAAAQQRISLADQEVLRARKEVTTARDEVRESRAATIETGLSAAQTEAETAEREYKLAFESGDGAAMAQAQRRMSRAEARMERLGEAKAELEAAQPEVARATERQPEPQPVHSADPVEAYVANRSPQTAAWLRAHPDYVTDQKKNAKLTAAHYDAAAQGYEPDTPDYFKHVEQFTGITKAPAATTDRAPQTRQRRPSVPAAPVSNAGGNGNGGGAEVTLTRGQRDAAVDGTHVWNYDDPSGKGKFKKGDPIGVQEFARRLYHQRQSGLLDRAFVE